MGVSEGFVIRHVIVHLTIHVVAIWTGNERPLGAGMLGARVSAGSDGVDGDILGQRAYLDADLLQLQELGIERGSKLVLVEDDCPLA